MAVFRVERNTGYTVMSNHHLRNKELTHSEAGEGLIFYGNVVLPFVDRFPKDTELYRVMTTKPEEVEGA